MKKIRIFIGGSALLASSLLINAASTDIEKPKPIKLIPLAQQMMHFEEGLAEQKKMYILENRLSAEKIEEKLDALREAFYAHINAEAFEEEDKRIEAQLDAEYEEKLAYNEQIERKQKQEKIKNQLIEAGFSNADISAIAQKKFETLTQKDLWRKFQSEHASDKDFLYFFGHSEKSSGEDLSRENKFSKQLKKQATALQWNRPRPKKYEEPPLTPELENRLGSLELTDIPHDQRRALDKREERTALLEYEKQYAESMMRNSKAAARYKKYFIETPQHQALLEKRVSSMLTRLQDIELTGIIHNKSSLEKELKELIDLIEKEKKERENREHASAWLKYFKENNALTDEIQQKLDLAILTGKVDNADVLKKQMRELRDSIESSKTLNENTATPTLPALDPKSTPAKSIPPRGKSVGASTTLPTVTSAPTTQQAPAKSMPPRPESAAVGTTTFPKLVPAKKTKAETREQRFERAVKIGEMYSNPGGGASHILAPQFVSTLKPVALPRPVTAPAKSMPPSAEPTAASTKLPTLAPATSTSSSSSSVSSRPIL